MAPAALSAASQASVTAGYRSGVRHDCGFPDADRPLLIRSRFAESTCPAQRLHEGSRLPDLLGKMIIVLTAGSWTIASI